MHTVAGDGVAGIKRRRRDVSSDCVWNFAMASGHGRLKEDLESSTWRWRQDYSKPSHEGYKNTIELPIGNNVVPLQSDTIQLVQNECSFHGLRRTIDQAAGVKLHDKKAEESWALLEDLALYDNESWNDPREFAKPVKAISLPQDVLRTSDRRLIELENQVQCLMEAHLAPTQPTQVNKITTSCEICSGPHDTQYCMKIPERAFVDYASSRIAETESRNPSSPKRVHFVNSIVILNKEDEAKEEGNVKTSTTEYEDHEMTIESKKEFEEETEDEIEEEKEDNPKHFDTFPTIKKLRYHEWLLKNARPPWVKAKVRTENLNNVTFSCMIGHFDKKQAYLDMESPINVTSRLHYN
uniref:MAK10-like protein n=1 Tax=Tanacetum cinerariifolium TaxID=118510 RepID=A0A6L2LAJ5_TANCI|nr:MAK10-like protein [Tanacetum cinerariifolium]